MKIDRIFEKKETIRYLFWGVVTTLINYFSYLFLKQFMAYHIANLCSMIITKVSAYFANKKFVFRTKTNFVEQILEIIRYILGRSFTGIVDYLGLIFLVKILTIDDRIGKVIMIGVVTVLNYLLGKIFVFRKKEEEEA